MGPRPAPPASSEAVAALVCGIMAWSCFPIGFVAVWLGVRARRAARANPEQVGGDQMALIGMIIGGFFGAIGMLFLMAYFAFFVFAIGFGTFSKLF